MKSQLDFPKIMKFRQHQSLRKKVAKRKQTLTLIGIVLMLIMFSTIDAHLAC